MKVVETISFLIAHVSDFDAVRDPWGGSMFCHHLDLLHQNVDIVLKHAIDHISEKFSEWVKPSAAVAEVAPGLSREEATLICVSLVKVMPVTSFLHRPILESEPSMM